MRHTRDNVLEISTEASDQVTRTLLADPNHAWVLPKEYTRLPER